MDGLLQRSFIEFIESSFIYGNCLDCQESTE